MLDRATLINVAHTSLATKLNPALAKQLAADVVDAVLTIRPPQSEGCVHHMYGNSRSLNHRRVERAYRSPYGRDHENAASDGIRDAARSGAGT